LKQDELAWEQAKAALAKAELAKTVYWQFEHPKDEKTRMSAVEEAGAELDRTTHQNESRLASKDADRKNRQQALTIREQTVAKYRKQIEKSTITAPQDGLVVYSTSLDNGMRWGQDDGPLHVGTKVFPSQTLIVLPDTSEMVAAVKVHESLASRIRPGQKATIKVDAVGDNRFVGTVEGVGVLAEQTSRWMDPNLREYTVRINLDTTQNEQANAPKLRPSMRCEAEIMLGRVNDAITVPIQAVFNEGMLRFVYLSDGSSRFVRRPVSLGQRSDRFAQITAGVKVGEHVLIRKPDAGEVVNKPWDEQELAAVGLKTDERGQIVSAGGGPGMRGGGGPGGGGGGRGPGGGGPGGAGGGGQRPPEPGAAPANNPGATPQGESSPNDKAAEKTKPGTSEPAKPEQAPSSQAK
jgi:multidrug efflux pump subunit AcrA (membrane-fusion protein)